jgi:Protein of unknown function (DUF4229)
MLRYSLLRLLIFFGVLAALWLLGLRDQDEQLILLVLGAIISMVISFFVLKPFREDYSRQIAERVERRAQARQRARDASDEQAEDAELAGDTGSAKATPERTRDPEDDGPVEYR